MKRLMTLSLFLVAAAGSVLGAEGVERARDLRFSGRYGDARAALEQALEVKADDPALLAELADLDLELGRFEDAAEVARKGGDDPRCRTLLAESLFSRGDVEGAEKLVARVLSADPENCRARYLSGLTRLEIGDREAAHSAFSWFFDYYAMNDVADPEALTLIAAASVRLAELEPGSKMDFHVTMKLLDKVTKDHEKYLPAFVEKARLYLSCYQDMSARKELQNALEINPRYPPALYGIAEQGAFRFNELAGVQECREALLTNPNLFEAKEYIARTMIGDSQYADATKLLDEVLAVNPRRKPARSLLAAISFLTGDRQEFRRRVEGVLADDPHFSGVYRELVHALEQQRRFQEAADQARKATEIDPSDYLAWGALGRNLVHVAKEKEAREALKKSREIDPFAHYMGNAFRHNMIDVLGHLEEFVETRTPHFIYKIHVGENEILTKYYHRFLERSWNVLTKKYGFVPKGPILTEIFHRHDDFAARTIGLPGIGALGACFGKVITLDSPSSRKPGAFVWASTAHHEFAHVITLQLSKGRVPRWFTEGLSVYEERCYADWWERDMDRRLYDVYRSDEIFPIAKFNREFRGPNVMFAYYLGGIMCEFMADEFGFDKIVEMLKAYGEDKQTAEVLGEVLGVSMDEYDARFRKWVGEYVKDWKLMPRWSKSAVRAAKRRLEDDPKDMDAIATLAEASLARGNTVDALGSLGKGLAIDVNEPRLLLVRGMLAFRSGRLDEAQKWLTRFFDAGGDDLDGRLAMAKVRENGGDYDGAIAELRAAKKCFPPYAGPNNPYLEISRLLEGEGDLDGAMAEVRQFIRLANTDIPHRMKLADYYEAKGDWESLVDVLTQVVWIYPLAEKSSMAVHVRLARGLLKLGRTEEAVVEYEVALELGVPDEDEPDVRVELGRALLLLGRTADARFHAQCVLEEHPNHAGALELARDAAED